jgi:RNA polymerase sigma-70 factor (ECF subfamily)
MTEQQAIQQIIAGKTDAFATLYDLYIDRVYKFIYYRTHHKQTAEDLTSIVFTKAFSKFGSFDVKQNFAVWIFRIARNTVIDHYRVTKSTLDLEHAFDLSDKANIARDYELKEKLDAAKQYLMALPEEQRDLVILRLWDGLSYEEIAQVLDKKEANLRVSFSRILSKMQKELTFVLIIAALIGGK